MADDETPDETPIDEPEPSEDAAGRPSPAGEPDAAGSESSGAPQEELDAALESDAVASDPSSGDSKPSRRSSRTAAIAVGAVLAIAAVVVGAVWAVTAVVGGDDDYYHGDDDYYHGDYGDDDYYHGDYGDDDYYDHDDRYDGDRRKARRTGEGKGFYDKWRQRERRERYEYKGFERGEPEGRDHEPAESDELAESAESFAGEDCRAVLRLGTGDDAVTVVLCNLPEADVPELELDRDFEGFGFRSPPRGLFPFIAPFMSPDFEPPARRFEGEGWPFGGGHPFRDGSFRDGGPCGGGHPFPDGWPFGGDGPYGGEHPFGGEWPFDSDLAVPYGEGWGFDGDLGGPFGDGGRGFWFESEGIEDGDGRNEEFCVGEDGEMSCFGGGLSGEQREDLERLMESFRQFGLADFLDDFLEGFFGESGLESWFDSDASRDESGGTSGAVGA